MRKIAEALKKSLKLIIPQSHNANVLLVFVLMSNPAGA